MTDPNRSNRLRLSHLRLPSILRGADECALGLVRAQDGPRTQIKTRDRLPKRNGRTCAADGWALNPIPWFKTDTEVGSETAASKKEKAEAPNVGASTIRFLHRDELQSALTCWLIASAQLLFPPRFVPRISWIEREMKLKSRLLDFGSRGIPRLLGSLRLHPSLSHQSVPTHRMGRRRYLVPRRPVAT